MQYVLHSHRSMKSNLTVLYVLNLGRRDFLRDSRRICVKRSPAGQSNLRFNILKKTWLVNHEVKMETDRGSKVWIRRMIGRFFSFRQISRP